MVDETESPPAQRRCLPDWAANARSRIAVQTALVHRFEPGSEMHRIATETLLLFQDSLHTILEARRVLDRTDVRLGR